MTIPKRPSLAPLSEPAPPSSRVGSVAPSRPPASGSFAPPGKRVILIVDDDATLRAALKAELEPEYQVIEAKDGIEAVEMAGQIQPPSLIVSDIVMPRVDGFTLAKILRGNPIMKRVPIMFLSSRNSAQDMTQAMALGARQYVVKTGSHADIVAKIRKVLG